MTDYVILYTTTPEIARVEGLPQRGLCFGENGQPFLGPYQAAQEFLVSIRKVFPESTYEIKRLESLQ